MRTAQNSDKVTTRSLEPDVHGLDIVFQLHRSTVRSNVIYECRTLLQIIWYQKYELCGAIQSLMYTRRTNCMAQVPAAAAVVGTSVPIYWLIHRVKCQQSLFRVAYSTLGQHVSHQIRYRISDLQRSVVCDTSEVSNGIIYFRSTWYPLYHAIHPFMVAFRQRIVHVKLQHESNP